MVFLRESAHKEVKGDAGKIKLITFLIWSRCDAMWGGGVGDSLSCHTHIRPCVTRVRGEVRLAKKKLSRVRVFYLSSPASGSVTINGVPGRKDPGSSTHERKKVHYKRRLMIKL